MSGDGAATSRIAVRRELVKEHLLDPLGEAAAAHAKDAVGPPLDAVLAATGAELLGETGLPLSEAAVAAATTLARAGYAGRIAETELFPAARAPVQWLQELLVQTVARDRGWLRAVVRTSAELARAEPAGKPDPGDARSRSWSVPGPGGHVRHYLALLEVSRLFPRDAAGRRDLPAPLGEHELKQAWMFGFYARCCEESLPEDASLDSTGG